MPVLDYGDPKTRRAFRIGCLVALGLGLVALGVSHMLTQQIHEIGQLKSGPGHTYLVLGRYYVPTTLGLARTLITIFGVLAAVTGAVLLGYREFRWRYLR